MLQHCQEENVGAPMTGEPSRDAAPLPQLVAKKRLLKGGNTGNQAAGVTRKGAELGPGCDTVGRALF